MRSVVKMAVAGAIAVTGVAAVYAAGGAKKTAETCSVDDDCARGHCYTKQSGDKVCVDCSASEISDYRGQISRYCKSEPRSCSSLPGTHEISEEWFKTRIENGDRCVTARDNENRRCWDGGDSGHRQAVDEAERARRNCYDEANTRKGDGRIYTCSDSTYSSRVNDVDRYCGDYGRACESWAKDDSQVSCRDIEDAGTKTNRCVEAVERIDSDCLPRLSSLRESQFGKAKKAYDYCKEVLSYKKDKGLCK